MGYWWPSRIGPWVLLFQEPALSIVHATGWVTMWLGRSFCRSVNTSPFNPDLAHYPSPTTRYSCCIYNKNNFYSCGINYRKPCLWAQCQSRSPSLWEFSLWSTWWTVYFWAESNEKNLKTCRYHKRDSEKNLVRQRNGKSFKVMRWEIISFLPILNKPQSVGITPMDPRWTMDWLHNSRSRMRMRPKRRNKIDPK